MSEPCRFLPWDSDFFGLRIAQVESNHLDNVSITQINYWCLQNNIDCLYFLADPDFSETIRLAELDQFHLVDIRVTMCHQYRPTKENNQPPPPLMIRPYQSSDMTELSNIARKSFTGSRFYSDPCFLRDKCDDLYDAWIKNSCEGYANQVLVADFDSVPKGFITCHVHENLQEGKIGLVGVNEESRGQGIGKSLVQSALRYFSERGVNSVSIAMQGSNIIAQRLCEQVGFSMYSLQLWYHKWFRDSTPDITKPGDMNWNR